MPDGSWFQRHRGLVVIVSAFLVLSAGVTALWFLVPGDPPEFPPGQAFEVEPPRLTVEGARSWGFESRAVMFAAKDGEVEIRASFAPDDGGSDVRPKAADSTVPVPARDSTHVVAILAADADEPWLAMCERVFERIAHFEYESVYLAGMASDGALGAVPLYLERPSSWRDVFRRRAHITSRDITSDGTYALEVRRWKSRVRSSSSGRRRPPPGRCAGR